jgi:hypothetical protein
VGRGGGVFSDVRLRTISIITSWEEIKTYTCPEPVFELPAHFTEWLQGARAALWAALWPDSGRPSAGPGLPFGPPLVLRAGLAALRAALRAAPLPRPFFEGRPERRPFFCKGRPHFEGGRPVGGPSAMVVAARSKTAGRPSGRPILEGGRPLFSGGPPELGQRAAPFGGWAAPVAAGRPAHQLGPIRPLTAHRLSGSYA